MELENVGVVSLLSSVDTVKQTNALTSLIQQSIEGKDIQSFLPTIVSSVLIKSHNNQVKKLCYDLIKSVTIISKDDWGFVEKSLISDLRLDDVECCTTAIRSIVSIYSGNLSKFYQFLLKYKDNLDKCFSSPPFRNDILKLYFNFGKLRKNSLMAYETKTVELFGKITLDGILDMNDDVSSCGFQVLREMICPDSPSHFHELKLPLKHTKEAQSWITEYTQHYDKLVERIQWMDMNERFYALKPISYLNETLPMDLLKPMLYNVHSKIVLETCFCILMRSDSLNDINYAINGLMSILERSESSYSRENIIRDILSCVHHIRDKYTICTKLMEHVSPITNDETRMAILSTIYKTLVKTSFYARMKFFLSNNKRILQESDIEMCKSEPFVDHVFKSPSDEFEEKLRCEMVFSMTREHLLLKPDPKLGESVQAWIQVGVEIAQQGVSSFLWKQTDTLHCVLFELSKLISRLSVEALAYTDLKKKVQEILSDLLNNYSQMNSEFAQLVTLVLLSNHIASENVSFKEAGETIHQHILSKLREKKSDGFLYALLCCCQKFSVKTKETIDYLSSRSDVEEKWILFLKNSNIPLDSIPFFKTYLSDQDHGIMKNSISARELKDGSKIQFKKHHHKVISQPSDPCMVTTSYYLYQNKVMVHCKVQNTSVMEMYQVAVELSVDGPFYIFDRNVQVLEMIGDLSPGVSHGFEREFILNRFKYSEFHFTITFSNKKRNAMDLMDEGEGEERLTIRCIPFEIKPFHFFTPKRLLHDDFLFLWDLFPWSLNKMTIFSIMDQLSAIELIMRPTPFSLVHVQNHQISSKRIHSCYVTKTIFGDYVLLVIICLEHPNGVNVCDWEFRTNSENVIGTLRSNSKWFREFTNGMTVLQSGSIEMENFNLLNHVKDDLRVSLKQSYGLEPQNVEELYLKKFLSLVK
jgi:hypothetical protein